MVKSFIFYLYSFEEEITQIKLINSIISINYKIHLGNYLI